MRAAAPAPPGPPSRPRGTLPGSGGVRLLSRLPAILLLLLAGAAGRLDGQQPGRQGELSAAEIEELRAEIREAEDRVIVGFKPAAAPRGLGPDARPRLSTAAVRELTEELEPRALTRVRRVYRLIPAAAAHLDPGALQTLLEDPRVDYVEPDRIGRPTGTGDGRPVQRTPWGVERVRAPEAWPRTRGEGVAVGVLDTGVDPGHPDLELAGGFNAVTGSTDRSEWTDDAPTCGAHGTRVTGIVGARDDAAGVVGVAPGADVYAVRVFDPEEIGISGCFLLFSDLIAGLQWSVEEGLDVVNMSLSGSNPSFALEDALRATAAAGVLPVASAGNTAGRVAFPAAYPTVLAVSATTRADTLAGFSSRGPEVEVTAPGVNVVTDRGGGVTARFSGTSASAPHVAGAAALVRALAPGLEPAGVRALLRRTARDLGPAGRDDAFGAGLLDAAAAAAAADRPPSPLELTPGDLHLTAEPGGSPAVDTVRLAAGGSARSWEAGTDVGWLRVSPASGTVGDTAGAAELEVAADPAGLPPGVHRGRVTVTAPGADPVRLGVRLSVARRLAVADSTVAAGALRPGERRRFAFRGREGQRVDVAVVADTAAPEEARLLDPEMRIFGPDGRSPVASVQSAHSAGLALQPLAGNLRLPEDGLYFVQVGAGPVQRSLDRSGDQRFLVKVRPAGPILRLFPTSGLHRLNAPEGGPDASSFVRVSSLTGVGSTAWEVVPEVDWIEVTPATGSIAPDGASRTVVGSGRAEGAGPVPAEVRLSRLRRRRVRGERPAPAELREAAAAVVQRRGRSGPGAGANGTDGTGPGSAGAAAARTRVDVAVDPSGFEVGDRVGWIGFRTDANWIAPFQRHAVTLRVHDPGFRFVDRDLPFVGLTAGTDRQALGVTFFNGDVRPIDPDGRVGDPLATGLRFGPGRMARTAGGDWLLGTVGFEPGILRVDRVSGDAAVWARPPGIPIDVTVGPDGAVFTPPVLTDRLYRVAPDGSGLQPFGGRVPAGWGVAYHPPDGHIYVAGLAASTLWRIDPASGATERVMTADQVDAPGIDRAFLLSLASGRSGRLYASDFTGRVWSVDPSVPSAELLGWTPSTEFLQSVALTEGRLVVADAFITGRAYTFPVDDAPAAVPPSADGITARLVGDAAAGRRGDTVSVPLQLDLTGVADTIGRVEAAVSWPGDPLAFVGARTGDVPGVRVTRLSAGAPAVRITVAPDRGLAGRLATPASLRFRVEPGAEPGTRLTPELTVGHAADPGGRELTDRVEAVSEPLCVSAHPRGDVDRDGRVGTGDAVQILRHAAGLPPAAGARPVAGDVTGDGRVEAGDALQVLRSVVGLPIPPGSRLGRFGVGACP